VQGTCHLALQVLGAGEFGPKQPGGPGVHLGDERRLIRLGVHAVLHEGEHRAGRLGFPVFLVRGRQPGRLLRAVALAEDEDHGVGFANAFKARELRRLCAGAEILGHNRLMSERQDGVAGRGAEGLHTGNEGADEDLHTRTI
jgi:hypothetical protein